MRPFGKREFCVIRFSMLFLAVDSQSFLFEKTTAIRTGNAVGCPRTGTGLRGRYSLFLMFWNRRLMGCRSHLPVYLSPMALHTRRGGEYLPAKITGEPGRLTGAGPAIRGRTPRRRWATRPIILFSIHARAKGPPGGQPDGPEVPL